MSELEHARRRYAQELRHLAEVKSDAIVEAFGAVPREAFLGPGPWKILQGASGYSTTPNADPAHVYANVVVAIDAARFLNNGEPAHHARMIEALQLRPGEHVVHIGAGTGYYTAILSELVGPTGQVTAIELDADLAATAARNLASRRHVHVHHDNGVTRRFANIDAMYVNAGVSHPIPAWLDALGAGGRSVFPLTLPRLQGGRMMRLSRIGDHFAAEFLLPILIFPCTGGRDPEWERLLQRAFESEPQVELGSLRRDAHERTDACWLHGDGVCLSKTPVSRKQPHR